MLRTVTLGLCCFDLRVGAVRLLADGRSDILAAAVKVSAHWTRILGAEVGGEVNEALGVAASGSTMSSALCMPCLARGLARRISGMVMLTVSFARFARSARRLALGGMTAVGCSLPMFIYCLGVRKADKSSPNNA